MNRGASCPSLFKEEIKMEKGKGLILEETVGIGEALEKMTEICTIKDEAETEELVKIAKSSKPTDILYLNHEDLMRYTRFLIEREIPEDVDTCDSRLFNVPADIVFANTIPVKDLLIKIDPTVTCRIVMVNDRERNAAIAKMINGEDETNYVVFGVIETITTYRNQEIREYFAMAVMDDSDIVAISTDVGIRGTKSLVDEFLNTERSQLSYMLFETQRLIDEAIICWYALQQCLLNPILVNYVSRYKEEVKSSRTRSKKKGKLPPKRYVKRNTILFDKMDREISINHEDKHKKKMPLWHVTGHWRTYKKTGKRIFVQGYWKGPLREYKYTDEPREREIVQYDNIVDNIIDAFNMNGD